MAAQGCVLVTLYMMHFSQIFSFLRGIYFASKCCLKLDALFTFIVYKTTDLCYITSIYCVFKLLLKRDIVI